MSRLALALVTLLIICSKVASSDQSNLLTVGGSSHYIITSEERDAAPEQLVPFTFADPRGGDIHNVTIHIDFCSQCGVVNLYLRRYSEPTRSIFEYERTIASTGTATSPATIIIKDISAHSESSSRSAPKIFMGLGFEEPECSFWLTVFNASYLTRHEGAHGLRNTSFTATRDDSSLTIQAPYIPGVMSVRLFWAPFSIEEGWCDLLPVGNWTSDNVFTIREAGEKMDLNSDAVLVLTAKFMDGTEENFKRFFLDAPPAKNAVRIVSNVLIPIMVLVPLIILFGGYHKKFGKRFLMFQYVSVFDQQQAPADIILRTATTHSLVLIGVQAVIQITVIILALSIERYLSLHLPIAVFAIPILLLGAIAVIRKEPSYLLGYIFMLVWFVAMQLSAMLILVNIGTDAISAGDYHRGMIFSQILIAIDVIVVIVSLSPLSFLYMKSAPVRSVRTYESDPSETQGAKYVLGLSFAYIALTITWMGVNLFFLPQLNLRLELVMHFFIEMHLTLAVALFSLFAVFAALYNNQLYATISIAIQVAAVPMILFFTIIDMANPDRYNDISEALAAKIVVYLFRILAFGCQVSSTIILYRMYPQLSDERFSFWDVIKLELNPKESLFPRIGRANVAVLASSLILCIVSIIMISLRLTGEKEYPQAYIMFYLLVLGQPAAIVGALSDTALLLVLTIALDLTPTLMWISYSAYGFGYLLALLWQLGRLLLITWAMVSSAIRHWKKERASPAERGLATNEFGAEFDEMGDPELEMDGLSPPRSPVRGQRPSIDHDDELEEEAKVHYDGNDLLEVEGLDEEDNDRI